VDRKGGRARFRSGLKSGGGRQVFAMDQYVWGQVFKTVKQTKGLSCWKVYHIYIFFCFC